MCADKTIKYDPAKSVLKCRIGDKITLNEADFARGSVSGAVVAGFEQAGGSGVDHVASCIPAAATASPTSIRPS